MTQQFPDHQFVTAVRQALYAQFVEGKHPEAEGIAQLLRVPKAAVQRAFQQLADARVILLRPGSHEVISAPPFYAEPSSYQVHTGKQSYWASCIWEALGIPATLKRNAFFTASCPDCKETMNLSIENGECRADRDSVFHFLVPASHFWENIFFTCANQLLFISENHIDRWCREKAYERGYSGSLQTVWQLAQKWYGTRLDSDFRRFTAEEAQKMFTELGLTGAFWKL